jgi:hypothetical protein
MVNYEDLEDAALYGIEESLGYDLAESESGYIEENGNLISVYQDDELAEQIYAQMNGWC